MKQEKTKVAEFLRNLEVLHFAGIGVILCRTKEGKRANDALQKFATQQNLPFEHWNCRDGWIKADSQGTLRSDFAVEPFSAMKSILDVDNSGASPKPEGVYVMHDLEYILGDQPHPGVVRCLKEYVRDFANREYRLVLVVPDTYSPPETLTSEVNVVDFDLPSRAELAETLDKVLQSSFVDDHGNPVEYTEPFTEPERERILNAAAGMTDLEAETALARAIVDNDKTWPLTPVDEFAQVLLKVKTELVKRSAILELVTPLHSDSFGGCDLLKDWCYKRAACFSPEAKAYGIFPPKGCALIGVPGTGKSVASRVIPHIFGMPPIRLDISRVFGSLVGQTEGRIRAALKQIEAQAPCVAWIDEIDKAGIDPRQGGGDGGTSKRVIGQILTFMAESDAPVFWVFTANRVDGLPPELLRKGRLDELFNVAPPNAIERREILEIHLRKRKQDPALVENLDLVVEESLGYVGAELEAAVNEAVIEAFSGAELDGELILAQLKSSVPIKEAFKEDFERMKVWAHNNARPASTPMEGEDTGGREDVAPARGRRVRQRRIQKGSAVE
jgi:hypothetical protein